MLDRAAQALKDWRLHAKALADYREGKISLAEARRRWTRRSRWGWPAPTGSTNKPTSTRKPPPANSHHPPWTASIDWRAVTLMSSPALLQKTVPRSPRPPPLGAVLILNSQHWPQPAPPHLREVMPHFQPHYESNRAWCCSVLVRASRPPSPESTAHRPPTRPRQTTAVGGTASASKAPVVPGDASWR
jgi:hypothetical protein